MIRLRDKQPERNSTPLRRPKKGKHRCQRRRGATLILVAILMVAFLATCAFSVDVARMHLANAELRAATDAAAKAAVTELSLTSDLSRAQQKAIQVAAANFVDGKPLILENQDIVFGRVQLQSNGSLLFVPGAVPYGAAQISARKLQSSPSGSIPLLFGPLLGRSTYDTQLTATAARLDRDVCLVLDRSGSMQGQKLVDLKNGVKVFLDTVSDPDVQPLVGLASYSTTATLNQALTSNLQTVEQKVNAMVADGSTNIGAGINTGRSILAGGHDPRFAEKIMVLMTDGIHNGAVSPEVAAQLAKQENIVIHTLTFGADADIERMRAIATTTGGTYHHALDSNALQAAFGEIAVTIRTALTQ